MRAISVLLSGALLAACSAAAPNGSGDEQGSGGSSAAVGGNATSGSVSVSGSSSVSGSASGSASVSGSGPISASGAGSVAGSDSGPSGGAAGAGGAPSSGGSGGGTAGNQSSGGVAGAGGTSSGSAPTPSAGCSKATGRPAGGKVTVAGDHIYDFPEKYDGKTPLPVLVALHAYGNPYTQLEGLTNGSKLATEMVRVFPKSAGSGWVYGTDAARVTKVIDDVLASYCVDTSRMFLTGHSSGAQMDVQMLCAQGGEKRFKAVAPVAASKVCQKISAIPVMYIQGQMDAQRGGGNGQDVVDFFTLSNGCMSATTPDSAVAGCKSTFDQQQVTPGCVTYQGCMAPTIWCSHNDNGYNNTDGRQHGWPCFASSAMADFFLGLP